MQRATYSVKDVAELTDHHPETIRRAIRDGELQAAKKGKTGPYRIGRDELQRWWTEERGGTPLPLDDG